MTVVGIVPAGGSGERLGADRPKAFVVCAGRPLLEWSVDVLRSVCSRVVVAVPPGFEEPPDRVTGGASRSESVRNALAAAPQATIAVVHDAARPLVTAELVQRCLAAIEGVDGAIAATPVTDTIHVVGTEAVIASTPSRAGLWAAQTPQVFRAELLRRVLHAADTEQLARATDEAALVVAAGGRVRVVEAPAGNVKVTTPRDLSLVESALC
jgi:2-C-methyl-D-erythritol 4-phosphate cytidylyltransferase